MINNKDATEEKLLKDLAENYFGDGRFIGISYIQRKYNIGYNKAKRIIDLGLKLKVFERKEDEPWRVRFV